MRRFWNWVKNDDETRTLYLEGIAFQVCLWLRQHFRFDQSDSELFFRRVYLSAVCLCLLQHNERQLVRR